MSGIVAGFANSALSVITSIFRRGHADDQVGEADGVALGQIVAPILSELLGGIAVQGTWMDVDPKSDQFIIAVQNGQYAALPSGRLAQLLDAGDSAIGQACQQFAAAGYPCHVYAQGKSGAGTLAFTKWERLRPFIQQAIALMRMKEAAASSVAAKAAAANVPAVVSLAGLGSLAELSKSVNVGGGISLPVWALAAGAGLTTWFLLRR